MRVSDLEVGAGIGALIVHFAAQRGVDVAALCAVTGFEPAVASDPDARMPLALEQRLWDEAARLAGDDAFGLHASAHIPHGIFGVLDYALRTAPTVRAALERLVRYNRLVHDTAEWSLVALGSTVRIEHAFRTSELAQSRHGAEFTIGSVIAMGSEIAKAPLHARAVGFHHALPPPEIVAEHVRFFGVEPSFGRVVNSIELDASVLDLPCPAADPTLSKVIERHADALLAARSPVGRSVTERVRATLAHAIGEGNVTLVGVARRLKMSERTLQRKLEAEGVTFDALLDDERRALALRYLGDRKLAVGEIAYLLGYSEPSPFHRAFKRWTGLTPAEARRRAA